MSRSDHKRTLFDNRSSKAGYLSQNGKPSWINPMAKQARGGVRRRIRMSLRAACHGDTDIDVSPRTQSPLDQFSHNIY